MKYYFGDNREYGAEDIKKALGTLAAGSGIELGLSDNKKYDPAALNSLIAGAVTRGVITESNSCLRLEQQNGDYVINTGRGIFSDGGIVEVEEDTQVDISGGQYLYIAYSEMLDDVYFLADTEEHTEGNGTLLIPIAYVENSGAIKDMRVYARGKVPALPSATWNVLREVEFAIDASTITHGDITKGGYVEARHPIDGDMNFMLIEKLETIGTMHITPQGATYHFVVGGSSRNYGHYEDYIAVGQGDSYYTATHLDSGTGYISMRYHFPKGIARGSYRYKALIGIKN